MKKREVSMPEMLLGEQGLSELSLITGVSGSGKSYFLDNAKLDKKLKVVDLDRVSAKLDSKWITNTAKVKGSDVVVGWSDNLVDVAKTLRDGFEEGEPLTLYWISPSPDIYRAANAAKAKDAGDELGSWKKDWAAKAKMSDNEINKLINAKLELLIAKIKPEELVIVRNVDAKLPIVDGWHGSPRPAKITKSLPPDREERGVA